MAYCINVAVLQILTHFIDISIFVSAMQMRNEGRKQLTRTTKTRNLLEGMTCGTCRERFSKRSQLVVHMSKHTAGL